MGSPNEVGAEPGTGPVGGSSTQEPTNAIAATQTSTTTSYSSSKESSTINGKAGGSTLEDDPGHQASSQSDHYCLRWTNHGSHMLGVFSQLLRDEALVDVTLAAEGQSVRAHKMVLSACSSFFRNLFISHPERHPIIILKDTKFEELKTLLEFIYKGEVSVEHGQLGTLLKTAENLRVKGLAEIATDPSGHPISSPPPPVADDSEEENSAIVVERDPAETVGVTEKPQSLSRDPGHLSYYPPPYLHGHHHQYHHLYDQPTQHHADLQYMNYGPYPFEYRDSRLSRENICTNGGHPNPAKPTLRLARLELATKDKENNVHDRKATNSNRSENPTLRDREGSIEETSPSRFDRNPTSAEENDKDRQRSCSPSPRTPTGDQPLKRDASNNAHPCTWPAEDSETSESEPDEVTESSRPNLNCQVLTQRPPIFQQGVRASATLEQSIPLSLKKEPEWDPGTGSAAGPGTSGMDIQPSRSPSFSDSSSDYGHHADQGHNRQDEEGRLSGNTVSFEELPGRGQPPKTDEGSRCSSVDSAAVPSTSRTFPCPHCGTIFPSASRLARHMLNHTVESAVAPICEPLNSEPEIRKGHKRRHMSAMHPTTESSLATMFSVSRPPSSAPVIPFGSVVRFDASSAEHHYRTMRSRHHSSEAYVAEDLRSRLHLEKQGPSAGLLTSSPSFHAPSIAADNGNPGRSRHSSSGGLAESDAEPRRDRHPNIAVREHLAILGQAGLEGSLGSLPGVAVLASLMGSDPQAAAAAVASDLSLGSVIFPRLSETQPSVTHSHSHFSNLGLSYSAAAAAAALGMTGHSSGSVTTQSCAASASAAQSTSSNPGTSSGAMRGPGPPALCKFCGKSFVELGALMAHLPFHTGERPFRCDFCGKAFKLRHHMKDHARVHTGERPFPCRLCGKTFSRSTILKAHEKTHLPKSERNFLQPQSPTAMSSTSTLPPS